jgi:hypothetical protein
MATKYKEYFDKMLSENKELFDDFKNLHAQYGMDEDKYQDDFNKMGEQILALTHEWENKLCQQSEKAGFGSFTNNLSEKFQAELRVAFPLIDHVGIISRRSTFNIKKLL